MTRYAVRHTTVYEYGGDVAHSHHLLHLTPREFEHQRCLSHSLRLDPLPNFLHEDLDAFGNRIARLEYARSHERLSVSAEMQVEVLPRRPVPLEDNEPWDRVRERLSYRASPMNDADLDACRFRMRSSHVPLKQAIEDYARECFPSGRPIGAAAQALTRQIYRDFDYVPDSTNNRTSITEVLASRRGVCQDFAHLMIGCLRSSGLAARYVSGYIRTSRAGESDALVGGDVSHAWVSVYCPPHGWIDFDPTNDCVVGEDHVTLAWGRDFGDVSPIRGMIVGGGRHKVSVDVGVTAHS
ncbi:MAG: transglutaminase family protein [Steroidobacteraceae bacterium]